MNKTEKRMRFGENAREHRFETVTVLGHPMLFTYAHLDTRTIPKGVHLYTVRHHSEDIEKPIQICSWALANRYGSLLSTTPIPLHHHPRFNNSFKNIDPDTDWEPNGYTVKLREYLEHYPIPTPHRRERER